MRQKRVAHVLKRNERTETWRHLVFFDTETSQEEIDDDIKKLSFKLGWSAMVRRDAQATHWCKIVSPAQWINELERGIPAKTKCVAIAHNLYFDFKVLGLHTLLPRRGWKLTASYFAEQGLVCFLSFRKEGKTLLFLDSLNFFGVTLRKLGETIGITKGEVNFDTVSDEALSSYCKTDVKIVKEAMLSWLSFLEGNDLGCAQKTLASQAMQSFRHRFMAHDIYIHTHEKAKDLERDAYHGGRVEVFYQGRVKGHVWQLDITSMYPSVMIRHDFPRKLVSYSRGDYEPAVAEKWIDTHCVIADCLIETQEPRYLCEHGDHNCYPIGTFWASLCTGALKSALHSGAVKQIRRIAVYEKAPLFEEFVRFFWEQRQAALTKGDKAYAFLYKIVMNSLYGKWGQKKRELIYEQPCDPSLFESGVEIVRGQLCTVHRAFGMEKYIAKKEEESYNAFPAISAHVTDYAREFLYEMMVQCGEKNLYYVDTDSLFVSEAGYRNVNHYIGSGLGKLKIEKEADDPIFYCPKDYEFGDIARRKGIRESAILDPKDGKWVQDQYERLRGGLRQKFGEGIYIKVIKKELKRELKTRRPGPEGWTWPHSVSV